jgi:trans-aconitate 2-methyltransferase
MTIWDPKQYERFKTYRDRPALDLMVQIPDDLKPREIWDLGCGPGEQAALLAKRHPGANVHGLDASAEMLAIARARPGAVDWVLGDIASFAPETPPDLIFTNAALQWLPDHATLFARLAQTLAPGGVFACQVPVTFQEPWHIQLRSTAAEGPWADKMQGVRDVQPVGSAVDYHRWLSPLCEVDVWSTTYLHVLDGEQPIIEWMKGTGLRPYLQRLDGDDEARAFLDAYRAKVDVDFPKQPDGTTLFPFPRLFMIARRR